MRRVMRRVAVVSLTVILVAGFMQTGAVASGTKDSADKGQAEMTPGAIPADKLQKWQGIKESLRKEFDVCVEHCGNDSDCVAKCEGAYKHRLIMERHNLLGAQASFNDIQERPSCPYCGMNREKFAFSRMYILYSDGSSVGTCSLHCTAIDLALKIDKTPDSIMVGDYDTKELIDAESASWVIGGKKMGVMTSRAKWAFGDQQSAQGFISQSGGEAAEFSAAIEAAFSDMYQDIQMIRKKRAMKRQGR